MTLEEVGRKYGISDAFLNSKEDGLIVASRSLQDIVRELKTKNVDDPLIQKLEYLAEFLREVKNSGW
jgi:hypothetical protein